MEVIFDLDGKTIEVLQPMGREDSDIFTGFVEIMEEAIRKLEECKLVHGVPEASLCRKEVEKLKSRADSLFAEYQATEHI